MPFLSVIIPHYNNVVLLGRCLKSLTDADLGDDVQVIVVDDGSTPEQRQQLETLLANQALRHLSIQAFYSPSNLGPSAARNRGLFAATGKFVWFVDADDEIDTETLKLCWPKLKEQDATVDLLHLGPMQPERPSQAPLELGSPRGVQGPVDRVELTIAPHSLDHTTYWISRQFLNQNPEIRYLEDVAILEDSIFILHLLDKAKSVVTAHDCRLYIRHNDAPSVTSGSWSKEKSARFLPSIQLFFTHFKTFTDTQALKHSSIQALYHRYCYVYMRVLAVKGVPHKLYMNAFFNPVIRNNFTPSNLKEKMLMTPFLHAILSTLCRLLRPSHN